MAMSTVNFRERFAQTRSEQSTYEGQDLHLAQVPEYFADRFGLHLVEFWSPHFESTERDHLKRLKRALRKSKSQLINIQLDESYDLGSADEAERDAGLALTLHWLEVADYLGSGALRINPGNGDVIKVIDALRQVNEVAKEKGIVLMVENHFGMEMDPDVHLKIVKEVGENMFTLPDFGNYAAEQRYASLQRIMPFAYQVSAKTIEFDEEGNHISFDFDHCMQICEDHGFKGIYSVEQWSPRPPAMSDEEIADWMLERVKAHCS